MAPLKAGLFAALALTLVACAAALPNVNGGKSCKYLDPRQINDLMRANGTTDAAVIEKVVSHLNSVNGMVCKSCNAKLGMQAVNAGALLPGFSECWCAPGYGAFTRTLKGGNTAQSTGCTPCPKNMTSHPTAGPYNNAKKTWTNTACVNVTTTSG